MADVLTFRPRTRPPEAQPDAPRPAPAGRAAAPAVSLALLLRAAGPDLQPPAVARAMLDARTNAAAAPIWRRARDRLLRLAGARGLDVVACIHLAHAFEDAVRRAGIEAKARRRAERAAFDAQLSTREGWEALLAAGDDGDRF